MPKKNPQLHEVLAIRSSAHPRCYARVTEIDRTLQAATKLNGFSKEWEKADDDGPEFDPESKKVEVIASELLAELGEVGTEMLDLEATVEYANQAARADVVVGGTVLIKDAPVSLLIHLEKKFLNDIKTLLSRVTTLEPAEDWSKDANSDLYKSRPRRTVKTQKVQEAIVKYPHQFGPEGQMLPAQTEMVSRDVIVGRWETTKTSGALPVPTQKAMLKRLVALQKAVKKARVEANSIEVDEKDIGDALMSYILEG